MGPKTSITVKLTGKEHVPVVLKKVNRALQGSSHPELSQLYMQEVGSRILQISMQYVTLEWPPKRTRSP